MSIEPGTQIGSFRIERVLGKGGMATVFLAVQTRLQRPVALKILSPALAQDEQFVKRFHLECINAARLEHPNIVPVYEAGEDGEYAFLAMKFVDGETMGALLARERRLQPADALRILGDVAKALEYAHAMGFVHRDVKPGNVLIDDHNHVYLSDFGLSKAIGSRGLTSTGQWMGTAEYMAPEQATGGPLDYRADLYALGCVAFECLTSDPPYLADSAVATIMAHTMNDIPSATALNLELPPGIDAVLQRALAKSADDRYASALAFVEALAAAVDERRLTSKADVADDVRRFGVPQPPVRVVETPVDPWPTSAPPSVPQATVPAPPVALVCPACVTEVQRGDVFCGSCGSELGWCGECGGPRLGADRFCQHCGALAR